MTPVTPNRKLKVVLARVKLWREGYTVAMQVLEQSIGSTDQEFQSITGMSVHTYFHPNLAKNIIFLRGSHTDLDDIVSYRSFNSETEAEGYLQRCQRTLRTPLYV